MAVWRRAAVLAALALPVIALGVLLAAVPAAASCADDPTLTAGNAAEQFARADLVAVATAVETTNRGRWATFQVEEIWQGALTGDTVAVRAGPEDPGGGSFASSSVERDYDRGVTYLLFASNPEAHGWDAQFGGGWEDNGCSSTTEWSDDLAVFRPADAHPPSPAGGQLAAGGEAETDGLSPEVTIAAGLAVLVAVVFGVYAARSVRQRPSRRDVGGR